MQCCQFMCIFLLGLDIEVNDKRTIHQQEVFHAQNITVNWNNASSAVIRLKNKGSTNITMTDNIKKFYSPQ